MYVSIYRQYVKIEKGNNLKMKWKPKGWQYINKQRILVVWEGDFSFSLSLARAFGSTTNLTATSLDTRGKSINTLITLYIFIKEPYVCHMILVTDICNKIIAAEIELNYANGKANIEELTRLGCTVIHGFNVHSMRLAPRSERYDRMIFNFPHSGFGFANEQHRHYIM